MRLTHYDEHKKRWQINNDYGAVMIDELKPCPFCGAQMNLGPHKELVAWHKENCFFNLMDEHEVDMTEDEIKDAFVEAWNRRANNG